MKNNIIYQVASWLWRNSFLKFYRWKKNREIERYWSEHRCTYGKENVDQTFYIIRRRDTYCGLFSILLTSLVRIDQALKRGYIPIVDMQNDLNIYLKKEEVGHVNAWEYYFKQPCNVTLNDITRSQNVIIGGGEVPPMFAYMDTDFLLGTDGNIEYWRKLVKNYVKLSEEAQKIVDQKYNELFDKNDKVLGIKCRGTDYLKGKPMNHPVQPTVEQILLKAEEMYNEYHCNKVFLATEDAKYYDCLKSHFGHKLITNKNEFFEYKGGSAGREQYESGTVPYEEGMEYLVTTMLLAKCDCLCAGRVSGTVGALLFTEGYEAVYLFDLGMY